MPPRSQDKPAKEAPSRCLEVQLWDAANAMRGAVPPSDYMHVASNEFLGHQVATRMGHTETTPIGIRLQGHQLYVTYDP